MNNDPKLSDSMPGHFKCPKCNFYLIQKSINLNLDIVGMNTETPDNCPNDGTEMLGVTWREHVKNQDEAINSLINRLKVGT